MFANVVMAWQRKTFSSMKKSLTKKDLQSNNLMAKTTCLNHFADMVRVDLKDRRSLPMHNSHLEPIFMKKGRVTV